MPSTISTANGPAASSYIYVDAALDGRKLRLLLDTGSPGEVMLFPQATRNSGLWNDGRPYVPTQLKGVGGTVETVGRTVRASSPTLGLAAARPVEGCPPPGAVGGAQQPRQAASPASEAGLKAGDVVLGSHWPMLRRSLDGPPGTVVSLQVETPAGPAKRQLTTRAFL